MVRSVGGRDFTVCVCVQDRDVGQEQRQSPGSAGRGRRPGEVGPHCYLTPDPQTPNPDTHTHTLTALRSLSSLPPSQKLHHPLYAGSYRGRCPGAEGQP